MSLNAFSGFLEGEEQHELAVVAAAETLQHTVLPRFASELRAHTITVLSSLTSSSHDHGIFHVLSAAAVYSAYVVLFVLQHQTGAELACPLQHECFMWCQPAQLMPRAGV